MFSIQCGHPSCARGGGRKRHKLTFHRIQFKRPWCKCVSIIHIREQRFKLTQRKSGCKSHTKLHATTFSYKCQQDISFTNVNWKTKTILAFLWCMSRFFLSNLVLWQQTGFEVFEVSAVVFHFLHCVMNSFPFISVQPWPEACTFVTAARQPLRNTSIKIMRSIRNTEKMIQ